MAVTVSHSAVGRECHIPVGADITARRQRPAAIDIVDGRAREIEEAAVVVVIGQHDANAVAHHKRAVEIVGVAVQIVLRRREHIAQVHVAIVPVYAANISRVVDIEKIVQIYLIYLVVLFL